MNTKDSKTEQPCTLHSVSHSTFKRSDYTTNTKDRAWQDPNCRIVDTRTGEVLKEYGTTVRPT